MRDEKAQIAAKWTMVERAINKRVNDDFYAYFE